MASQNAKNNVTAPFIGVAVVLLVIVLGWLGYKNFFAPPPTPPRGTLSADQQQQADWIDQMAKKSHGNVDNLSADEKVKLMQQTGGHGDMVLRSIAKDKGY